MAKVKIQGHASGTGILTVTAPNTSTDRTITLPDATGTLAITTDDDDKLPLAGGTLTGALTGTTATFSTADNTDTLSLISTDADANAAPNLRLYRNSASPYSDDLLGQIDFEGRNDNSQDVVYYQIKTMSTDITDGNEESVVHHKIMKSGTLRDVLYLGRTEVAINRDAQDIDFRVESDTNANALFVQGSNGNVGIGTNNPASNLEVQTTGGGSLATILIDGGTDGGSDGGSRLHMKYGGSQYWAIQHRNQTSIGSAHALVIGDADLDNGAYINQNSNSWSGVSDERLKTSISQIENAVDKLNTLQAVNFKWKYGSEERKIQNNLGLLAQEVYEVFPEAVDYHEIEDFELIDHPTIEGTKQAKGALGISPTVLIAPLVKAIQELSAKNEELTTRIETLEAE